MLEDLFSRLTRPDFQDFRTGLLTFPAYIYTYPAEQEYRFREEVCELRDRLRRPNHFLDCLLINVYDAFLDYLRVQDLGNGDNLLNDILQSDESSPELNRRTILRHIQTEAFTGFVARMIRTHMADGNPRTRTPYVLVHGFGSVFPFLRTNDFLTRFEPHVTDYKMILFYPGEYEDNRYRMFGRLEPRPVYRASCLNDTIKSR